jgi:hypothetical protein
MKLIYQNFETAKKEEQQKLVKEKLKEEKERQLKIQKKRLEVKEDSEDSVAANIYIEEEHGERGNGLEQMQ